jgi:hypothetical protein
MLPSKWLLVPKVTAHVVTKKIFFATARPLKVILIPELIKSVPAIWNIQTLWMQAIEAMPYAGLSGYICINKYKTWPAGTAA